jgi:hypothetical protein
MTRPSAYGLEYLRAAADLLERYLLSDEIYWQLNGRGVSGELLPSLTLGGVLLAKKCTQALLESTPQAAELWQIEAQIDHLRNKWQVAWEKKAAHEISARLKLWRDFLEDYKRDPENNADRYPYEVGRRVMLSLLQSETNLVPTAESDLLTLLDNFLNSRLVPAGFIWDHSLEAAFPKDQFPFLYGVLKTGLTSPLED